jgi:hypothetical protein
MKPDKASKEKGSDPTGRLYITILVFAASLLASALVVIYNNSTRSVAIFVFLLFFGSGIMLALGLIRGVLVSLLMITIWISLKQLLGVWEEVRLLDHMLELLLVGLTFIL